MAPAEARSGPGGEDLDLDTAMAMIADRPGMTGEAPVLTGMVMFTWRLRQPDPGNPPGADVEIHSAP
jgi:hypothetical protein